MVCLIYQEKKKNETGARLWLNFYLEIHKKTSTQIQVML